MWSVIGILYFTVCYYLPNIFGGDRNVDCSANTALAVGMFGWAVIGSQLFVHILFILAFGCKKASAPPSMVMQEFV